MDSETIGDFDDDYLNSKRRARRSENIKVYTRRVRKKAQNTISDNDTATIAVNPAAVSTNSENHTSISASEVSSPAIATTTGADVAAASTFRKPSNSAAASITLSITGSLAATTKSCTFSDNNDPRECVGALVSEDVDSPQKSLQMQLPILEKIPPSQTPGDKDEELKQSQPLVGLLQHEEQSPSLSEGNFLIQNGARDGGVAWQALESQNFKRLSPLPNNEEVRNPKETNLHHIDNEKLQASGIELQKLCEQSPLSTVNNLPNCEDNVTTRLPNGNKPQNDDPSGNGNVDGVVEPLTITRVDDRIIFCVSKATQKGDIKELRRKFECELDQVRRLVNQLEVKESQLASSNIQVSDGNLNNIDSRVEDSNIGYCPPQILDVSNDVVERKELVKINSQVSVMGHQETIPMRFARVNSDIGTARTIEPRSYSRQLSVAVMESTHDAGEIVDKEKRTPKANQYYRNSEFLLGKDRLPSESNKKMKKVNGRKHGSRTEQVHGFGFGFDKNRNQVFRSCSSLLQRLMKHKHSWVFNEPVDAKALGLHDYHVIIKHPMDLGTIKIRLSQNWYKSPKSFAEDVRLVFHNAMTYNPKGQDVHIMAEELSDIFEEKWAIIETKYNPYLKYHVYQDAGFPTPTSRKFPPQPLATPASSLVSAPVSIHHFTSGAAPTQMLALSAPTLQNSDRAQTTTVPMAINSKIQRPHVGRTPVPKKPKAKDPNKRDMTYEEKQRLSTNLQTLASEKLDAIIQIIKKNDTALSQHDDEIEVDIDSVDPETLWELDRFVTNYKKGLSKNKRKAELALQARTISNQSVTLMNSTPAVLEVQSKSETGVIDKSNSPPAVEGEKHGNNASRSSSSSSSSSDSESSSSDSDSGNSSADGSGAG